VTFHRLPPGEAGSSRRNVAVRGNAAGCSTAPGFFAWRTARGPKKKKTSSAFLLFSTRRLRFTALGLATPAGPGLQPKDPIIRAPIRPIMPRPQRRPASDHLVGGAQAYQHTFGDCHAGTETKLLFEQNTGPSYHFPAEEEKRQNSIPPDDPHRPSREKRKRIKKKKKKQSPSCFTVTAMAVSADGLYLGEDHAGAISGACPLACGRAATGATLQHRRILE